VLVSLLPMVYEVVKHRREARALAAEPADASADVVDPVSRRDRTS
jgi:membrane-associated protein